VRILLTGRNGQVGWELERSLAPLGEIIATDRAALDLGDPDAIRRVVREAKPELVVNAAAYTAVDKAESEPELAMRINGVAAGVLAAEAKRLGAWLIHYSTDYVFDGSGKRPYSEGDATNPINAYGRSKLAGEQAIAASGARYLILRSSWVYGSRGRNFLLAILQRAHSGAALRVVDDQIGAPTWCRQIAEVTARIVAGRSDVGGTYHLSAGGETTWCGFARAIMALAGIDAGVQPIATAEYPTAAKRPRYSVLDCAKLARDFGVALPDWRDGLARCMAERV
jgi:dTDP-4-dehydrorhamnose reductase